MTVAIQSPTFGRPAPLRWTGKEFDLASEAGIFDGRRVELINGEILEMGPMNDPHAAAIQDIHYVLLNVFPPSHSTIRSQCPMRLGEVRPFPDFVIVNGPPSKVRKHPVMALLVIEVSDTTLEYDQTEKAELYALHGLPEYWIVDLNGMCLEVRRNPGYSPGAAPRYADLKIFNKDQEIAPLAAPQSSIKVADLLPTPEAE